MEYEKTAEQPSLSEFLENIALITDLDSYNSDADAVVLMTMHSAKGLEFPNVFIVGAEDGIFPGEMSILEGEKGIEEERRLMYVAITRAKEKLHISKAKSRMLFGFTNRKRPSRFLAEIPDGLLVNEGVSESNTPTFSFGESHSQIPPETYYRRPESKPPFAPKRASAPKPAAKCDYKPGDRVRHKAFGDGMVVSVSPMANDMMLQIAFEKVGTKKLMANFANITKI